VVRAVVVAVMALVVVMVMALVMAVVPGGVIGPMARLRDPGSANHYCAGHAEQRDRP
jgi:hypothetical protein